MTHTESAKTAKTAQEAKTMAHMNEIDKKSAEYLRDRDRQKVKGIFRFYEVPGGSMSFVFKKHKGDQIERYDMIDGEVYEVPLAVAKHLNSSVWYPIHAFLEDENGKPTQRVGQRVQRCGFQSLEFINDIDLVEPNQKKSIITVTGL